MWKVNAIHVLWIILLTWLSVTDIRYRRIQKWFLAAGAILIAASLIMGQEPEWLLRAGGVGVGILFVLVSRVTREALGYGDSLLICMMGGAFGLWVLLEILAVAWGLLAFAAMACLAGRRYSRKRTLPMIPFLTAGCGLVLFVQYI